MATVGGTKTQNLHQHLTCCITHYQLPNIIRAGIILCMRPANERRRYSVTSSLIGWAHTQNDPRKGVNELGCISKAKKARSCPFINKKIGKHVMSWWFQKSFKLLETGGCKYALINSVMIGSENKNICIYYCHQTHEIYQVLPHSVDLKSHGELWVRQFLVNVALFGMKNL